MTSLVMITGATGGLGRAFAVECASRGWDLFLTDLRPDLLELLAGGLRRTYGVRVLYRASDLADLGSRARLFEDLHGDHLQFWALLNIAGVEFEGPFQEQGRQQIRDILRLNIEGTLEVTHALLELRDPAATFRIITVSSLAAFYPMPVKATYAASKRFLLDFSLALGAEVSDQDATVTVLCPAGLPTKRHSIQGIEAQGLIGHLTTQSIGAVAADTLDYALQGRTLYIPGFFNRLLRFLGSLVPPALAASFLGKRWKTMRRLSQKQLAQLQDAAPTVKSPLKRDY